MTATGRATSLLVLLAATIASAQQGAYEAELRRRQYEYQQQLLAQQQAQQAGYTGGGGYGGGASNAKAAQQQQLLRAAQQQKALERERMEQQLYMEAMAAKMKRERAAEQSGGMGASGRRPNMQGMSKSDRKKLEKAQKEKEKQVKKAQEQRQKAFKNAQKAAAKGGGRPAYGMGAGGRTATRGGMQVKPKRGGLVGFVFSPKGLVSLGVLGYLYLQQRPLLTRLTAVPLMIATTLIKKAWSLLLRPLIRRVLVMRSSSRGPAAVGGELPGGSY